MQDVNTEGWKDFFVAVAGAASALTGLVFVALSINLAKILEISGLAARAGETIILLAAALLTALIALVPGLSAQTLGLALGLVGLIAWFVPIVLQIAAGRAKQYQTRRQFLVRVLLHQAATIPFLLASLSLLGLTVGGIYWLALGIILAFAVGLQNAWVLLVEILR